MVLIEIIYLVHLHSLFTIKYIILRNFIFRGDQMIIILTEWPFGVIIKS